MPGSRRALAVVTGASSGIGRALANCCVEHGYDLLIAADEPAIDVAAKELRARGAEVTAIEADLATDAGVQTLYAAAADRPVEVLIANAGHGLGRAFLEQDFQLVRHVIDTNITGTIALIQRIGRDMLVRRSGRILIVGSIAGFIPGAYSAVYNGTKAFIDSFAFALRAELKNSGVTVTCLMPGATETAFFERAGMMDTKLGQQEKDDPAEVAQVGFQAMLRGEGDVVAGWKNKVSSAIAAITPADTLAEQHRRVAKPGSAYDD